MVEDKLIQQLKSQKISITEDTILERLLDRYRWPKLYSRDFQPSVEAIKEDGTKHQDFFDDDDYLNSLDCIKSYEEGYSLIISKAGTLCKDLWLIQQILNQNYQKHINCNLYFGNGKKSVSFSKHNHPYPVIVKNIYGTSKWIIDEKQVVLEDQDVIWFDRGVDHQVIEISDAKLSLTCNIQ